jgi:hypothetical protein
MRAPPLDEKHTSAARRSMHLSTDRLNRAHRAAQELELERAGHHRQGFHGARDRNERITLAGGFLRRGQPVAITLAVAELQRIFGRNLGTDLFLADLIEKTSQPFAAADAHVMAALRADIEIAFELGTVQHRVAGRTLDPQTLWDRTRAALGLDTRGHDFLEPRHGATIPKSKSGR